MFDWLFEGRLPVYIALAAAAVLLYFFGTQSRRRSLLYAAGACLALVAVYFLLDRFVETDREQIRRKLREMSAAVQAGDVDGIFRNISDDFKRGTANKAAFRRQAEGVIRGGVNEVQIWNVTVADDPGGGLAGVEFLAKPRGGIADGTTYYLIRAQMKRDPDGQWRLKGFDAFNPYSDSNTPLQIPELPH